MRAEPEWPLARRIAQLVADSPGRGLRRDELLERLGMSWADVKPSAMLAYKRGGIDFLRDFVIAPARKAGPQPPAISGAISRDTPQTPRQDTTRTLD